MLGWSVAVHVEQWRVLSCYLNPPPTDVSLNVFPWTMSILDDVSLGRYVPVRSIPYWGEGGGG
jgi:hypothetical protein